MAPARWPVDLAIDLEMAVIHALNRFGGQMGPYVDARLLALRSVEYISGVADGPTSSRKFVATMCPERETVARFWSMVWGSSARRSSST